MAFKLLTCQGIIALGKGFVLAICPNYASLFSFSTSIWCVDRISELILMLREKRSLCHGVEALVPAHTAADHSSLFYNAGTYLRITSHLPSHLTLHRTWAYPGGTPPALLVTRQATKTWPWRLPMAAHWRHSSQVCISWFARWHDHGCGCPDCCTIMEFIHCCVFVCTDQ